MDALGIQRAHLVGMSMGGMIAQLMAIGWEERFRSICSVSSDTGNSPRQSAALTTYLHLFVTRPWYKPGPDASEQEIAAYDASGVVCVCSQ